MPSCGRRLLILLGTAIEAAAYRSVVEGRDGQPARPEVLRDLINDGALGAPICFGVAAELPRRCRTVATENPLLQWPQPFTDRPDHNYARQFTEPGQCVHFMGMLQDEASALLPGRHVPRALATSALVRCRDMLDDILRQVVLVGGVGTRESGYGLYELMHAVTDSFSHAHTERQPGTHRIDFLRVWGPIGKLAMSRLSDYFADSPLQHDADDPRDSSYVRNFAQVNGLPCKDLTALPYTVPFPCLSEEGDLARQALLELPFDRRAAVGFSPLSARYTLGGSSKGWDISTQAFHYEFHVAENIAVSVLGPVELDWRRVSLDWAFGVVVGYTPSRRHVAGGPLIGPPPSTVPRHDDQWAPEPLWFGHLKGVESTWYLFVAMTPIPQRSAGTSPVLGGLGALGARLMWDRDPWSLPIATSYGGSRVGVALSAGMIDLLLQAPTLAWQAHRPLDTGEILTLRVSLRPGGV